MFERFTREGRAVVIRAEKEASDLGSQTVEAEHMLMAMAGHPVLDEAGVDRAFVLDALEQEEMRSLAAVGVAAEAYEFGSPAAVRVKTKPKFATSGKSALERAFVYAVHRGHKKISESHVLVGVLSAKSGTVPRALRVAGVDPTDLHAKAEAHVVRTGR